jgi:origin recognition complex subunit 1
VQLWEKLAGQRLGPGRALAALEAMFGVGSSSSSTSRRGMTLLVVDEIDVLITRDQSVRHSWSLGTLCV